MKNLFDEVLGYQFFLIRDYALLGSLVFFFLIFLAFIMSLRSIFRDIFGIISLSPNLIFVENFLPNVAWKTRGEQ